MKTIRRKLEDWSLNLAAYFATWRRTDGITTVEVLLILGVATIILGGTYYGLKTTVPTWWGKYISPQFPQS